VRAVVESHHPEDVATAIAEALQADNASKKVTTVSTASEDGLVRSLVEAPTIEKLLPVLDDLLFCQSLCERTLGLTENE
jgi:hypothetical protein